MPIGRESIDKSRKKTYKQNNIVTTLTDTRIQALKKRLWQIQEQKTSSYKK